METIHEVIPLAPRRNASLRPHHHLPSFPPAFPLPRSPSGPYLASHPPRPWVSTSASTPASIPATPSGSTTTNSGPARYTSVQNAAESNALPPPILPGSASWQLSSPSLASRTARQAGGTTPVLVPRRASSSSIASFASSSTSSLWTGASPSASASAIESAYEAKRGSAHVGRSSNGNSNGNSNSNSNRNSNSYSYSKGTSQTSSAMASSTLTTLSSGQPLTSSHFSAADPDAVFGYRTTTHARTGRVHVLHVPTHVSFVPTAHPQTAVSITPERIVIDTIYPPTLCRHPAAPPVGHDGGNGYASAPTGPSMRTAAADVLHTLRDHEASLLAALEQVRTMNLSAGLVEEIAFGVRGTTVFPPPVSGARVGAALFGDGEEDGGCPCVCCSVGCKAPVYATAREVPGLESRLCPLPEPASTASVPTATPIRRAAVPAPIHSLQHEIDPRNAPTSAYPVRGEVVERTVRISQPGRESQLSEYGHPGLVSTDAAHRPLRRASSVASSEGGLAAAAVVPPPRRSSKAYARLGASGPSRASRSTSTLPAAVPASASTPAGFGAGAGRRSVDPGVLGRKSLDSRFASLRGVMVASEAGRPVVAPGGVDGRDWTRAQAETEARAGVQQGMVGRSPSALKGSASASGAVDGAKPKDSRFARLRRSFEASVRRKKASEQEQGTGARVAQEGMVATDEVGRRGVSVV